jgi:hypothetical protein
MGSGKYSSTPFNFLPLEGGLDGNAFRPNLLFAVRQ